MTKFLNKSKNLVFGPYLVHFPNFGGKKQIFWNIWLCTTSYGFLAPCQNLEKTDDTIPRKHPERRTDGRKVRQTLFHRTLPATAGSPKKGG